MTTCLGKSCSFGLPRVPFVNCCQFMYFVLSLLVLRAGYGIWLYQFLNITYRFTYTRDLHSSQSRPKIYGDIFSRSVRLKDFCRDFISVLVFGIYDFPFIYYAPVIWKPGPYGAADSGDIVGLKCRDLTSNESRQYRRCAGVLISR